MNLLQYTSNEMYSSTDLIRKSKPIFDKLTKKEIDKAVILRDGKPSFMLLDFETYEKIMIEYTKLKENTQINEVKKVELIKPKILENSTTYTEKDKIIEKETLNDEDLQKALAEIDKLDFSFQKEENKKETPLKEFWE